MTDILSGSTVSVNIENSGGTVINPSTEDKQTTGNSSLSSIDGKVATSSNQTNGTQKVIIANATDTAAIVTGSNTSVKGLRVYGGPTDPISDIPVGIDYDHHQNHEGEAYQWFYHNTALNGTVNFRLSVPNLAATTRTPHLRIEYMADTTTTLYLFEGPTVNAAGTASTTIRNRNRNSLNTAGLVIYTGSTFTSDGTELYRGITVAAAKSSLSVDQSQTEWILKTSTEYLVRIVTTGASIVMLRFHWYEDLGV